MTWASFVWRLGLLYRLHARRVRTGWLVWRRRHRRSRRVPAWRSPLGWPVGIGGTVGGMLPGIGGALSGFAALTAQHGAGLQNAAGLQALSEMQEQAMRGLLNARGACAPVGHMYEQEMQRAMQRQMEHAHPNPYRAPAWP